MATRIYGISAGETNVTEGVGSAVAADSVELTVELASTAVNTTGGTRALDKVEVLEAIERIKNHIIEGNWPPA